MYEHSSCIVLVGVVILVIFFFQAEDGIRDLVRSRGLGDVYKRQTMPTPCESCPLRLARTRLSATVFASCAELPAARMLSLIHI